MYSVTDFHSQTLYFTKSQNMPMPDKISRSHVDPDPITYNV